MVALMAKLHDGTHHAVLVKKGSVVRKADEEDAMSKQTKVQKQNAAIAKHVKGQKAAKAHAVSPAMHSILTEQMLAKGLWATTGATPSSTLYSALIREIANRKDASRFKKTGPGEFALAK
jgi:hypothetical protein